MDRKDFGILSAIVMVGVLLALLTVAGCIAVIADKVEMKDPKPPPDNRATFIEPVHDVCTEEGR